MQENMKCNNIHIIGIPGGEEEGIENLFEKLIMENFPNERHIMREKVTQIQETQSPNQKECKESCFKTHHHRSGKIPRQRENIKGNKGETVNNIQGSPDKFSS